MDSKVETILLRIHTCSWFKGVGFLKIFYLPTIETFMLFLMIYLAFKVDLPVFFGY